MKLQSLFTSLSRVGQAFKSRLDHFLSLADPIRAARAEEEAYLSEAVDLHHLEALQRSWDRRHGNPAWRFSA